jgi:hypothetical protein
VEAICSEAQTIECLLEAEAGELLEAVYQVSVEAICSEAQTW